MKILIVDDEDDARDLLAFMLRDEGHVVDGCADAALALARLEAARYDVMITDQTMPRMSGLELVLAARRLQSELRCIIVSGLAAPDESERFDTAWIMKPLDIEAVLALLEPA